MPWVAAGASAGQRARTPISMPFSVITASAVAATSPYRSQRRPAFRAAVALNDFGKIILGEANLAEDRHEKGRLCLDVTDAIVREVAREALLEITIGTRHGGICPEMVADRKMIRERHARRRAQVQMMGRRSGRRPKCLTLWNTAITAMQVAEGLQSRDSNGYRHLMNNDIDVDYRFGSEPRYGRAADVLDRDRDVADRVPDGRA
jgi:hypothetical protein